MWHPELQISQEGLLLLLVLILPTIHPQGTVLQAERRYLMDRWSLRISFAALSYRKLQT